MAAATAAVFPRIFAEASLFSPRWTPLYTRKFASRLLPMLALAIPGVSLNIPSLGDIWESVLRAAPKNKTSHSRKRQRQMAGKALKDVHSLCKCPGCGATKRTHRICPHCLNGMPLVYSRSSELIVTDIIYRNKRNVAQRC